MRLTQSVRLITRIPEETRIKIIRKRYVYPFVHPASLEEVKDVAALLGKVYTEEHCRDVYLTVDGRWRYDTDENLLDVTTPYYEYRDVVNCARFYALHKYFETHYQLGIDEEHVITQEDFDNLLTYIKSIYKMVMSSHKNIPVSLPLEDFENIEGFFYDISGYDIWPLHNICDFYQYLHTLNRSFQKLGEGQTLVYTAWYTY